MVLIARMGLLCAVLAVTALLTAGIAAASPASPDSDAGMPTWPFAVGAIAAVAVSGSTSGVNWRFAESQVRSAAENIARLVVMSTEGIAPMIAD